MTFKIEGFLLQGKEVKEIVVKGKAALEKIDLNVPMTLAYGMPRSNAEDRNVYIQKFDLGQTDIVHHNGNISICVDLSKLEVPPFWQFRFVEVLGKNENYLEQFEIIEPEKMNMKVELCNVHLGAVQ